MLAINAKIWYYTINMVFQEYQDPTVAKYLKYGYWYRAHKEKLFKILRLSLIIISSLSFLATGFFAYGLLMSPNQAQVISQITAPLSSIAEMHQKFAPAEPRLLETSVVAIDENSVNFIAIVENPNKNWYMEIEYVFSWDGGETTSQTTWLLPGERTMLSSGSVTVALLPATASFRSRVTKWQRIKDALVLDRWSNILSNLRFVDQSVNNDEAGTSVLYTVQNSSIYDLRDIRFMVALSQIGKVAAVSINQIENLSAQTSVALESRFLSSLPTNLSVDIYPRINLFEQSSFGNAAFEQIQF